ncbi:MAG: hypothetical protein ABJF09_00655 [Qipengyuania citrea]
MNDAAAFAPRHQVLRGIAATARAADAIARTAFRISDRPHTERDTHGRSH